jgi:DNA-binding NarL/FixJ family response regulator
MHRQGQNVPASSAGPTLVKCPMRVLIVDDHTLFRDSLAALLDQWRTDIEILTAGTLRDGLGQLIKTADIDLVIADLGLPDETGPGNVAAKIVDSAQAVPVMIVSMMETRSVIEETMRAGARGFIKKSQGGKVLLAAIELILAGGTSFPAIKDDASNDLPKWAERLSPRQIQVVGLLARGLSNKEIARELKLAEATVKIHVHRCLQLLNVPSRAKAAQLVQVAGRE